MGLKLPAAAAKGGNRRQKWKIWGDTLHKLKVYAR